MRIRNLAPTVQRNWFRDLHKQCPGTAADRLPIVIWTDSVGDPSQSTVLSHDDFCSLYLVRQGRGTHIIDGKHYGVARGDVYVMGVGSVHQYVDCDGFVADTIHFSPTMFDAATLDSLAATPGFLSLFVEEPLARGIAEESGRWLHLTPDAYTSTTLALAELKQEWGSGTPDGTLLTHALFLRFLIHLARLFAASKRGESAEKLSSASHHEATIAAAVRYLDEHFSETLRIDHLAATVFLSPDRFTEVFAAAMGRTPSDYLRYLRIERAKTLLLTTDAAVSEVGGEAGFPDPAYFSRIFRSATGLSPRGFRERQGR